MKYRLKAHLTRKIITNIRTLLIFSPLLDSKEKIDPVYKVTYEIAHPSVFKMKKNKSKRKKAKNPA